MAPKKKASSPLAVALTVVEKLMQLPVAIQLFNTPVDISVLTDYRDVVKKPMDLGTIRARLAAGQSKGDATTAYSSPVEVLEDIKLVWNNCILYNSRPDEEHIAQAAREMAQKTSELWVAAGLGGNPRSSLAMQSTESIPETDIPSSLNMQGQFDVPIRIIQNLNVYGEDRGVVRMWTLDCHMNSLGTLPGSSTSSVPAAIYGRGSLKPQDAAISSDESPSGLEVEIGPILDWSVTVGEEAHVWIQTSKAWYQVASAAQDYEPLFLLPILFARLCKAVVTSLQEMPTVELDGLLVLVCKYLLQTHSKESLLFHIKLCIPQLRVFLLAWADTQDAAMAAALGSGENPGSATADSISAARRLAEALQEMQGGNMDNRLKHIARVVGQLRQHCSANAGPEGKPAVADEDYIKAMTAEPRPLTIEGLLLATAGGGSDAEKRRAHLESKRVYEAERRRRKAAEEDLARTAAEAAASVARGAPPPLRGSWRTPAALLPNLLSIWDFLGTFADLIWLPPIPLARLDAALCPDATGPSAEDEASAIVLRDIHCAFLRVLEGRAGKGSQPPTLPVLRSGKTNIVPCVGDHHWQVRLAKVLEGRAYDAAVQAEPHAAEALDALRAGDYLSMSLKHRFAILNLLLSIALNTDLLRNEITYRVDDFHVIRLQERGLAANNAPKNGEKGKGGKGRKGSKAATANAGGDGAVLSPLNGSRQGGAATMGAPRNGSSSSPAGDGAAKSDGADDESMTEDDGSGDDDRSGSGGRGDEDDDADGGQAAEVDAAAAAGMQAWWDFMYYSRVGLRRFLGMDATGRKYWLMAGRAGAYQVVVEARPQVPDPVSGEAVGAGSSKAEPSPWGVYVPSDIFKLICWLRAGGMAQEESLLAALERAPLPQPDAGLPASAEVWRDVPVSAAASDLDGMLPDGYRGLLGPMLPGVLIQPFTLPREEPPPATQARRALHAAATSLRFWKHGHADAALTARTALMQLLLQLHGNTLQPSAAPRLGAPGAPPNPAATLEALRRDTDAVTKALTAASAMGPEWATRHARWHELLATAQSMRDLLSLISVFCQNIAWRRDPQVMHRGSFHNYTATQHIPLHFPTPGDRVAVLRSGLLANIQRIRDAVLSPPRWSGRDGGGPGGVQRTGSGAVEGDPQRANSADVKAEVTLEIKPEADVEMKAVEHDNQELGGAPLNGLPKAPSELPPVPPPTPSQQAWLQEMSEVEQVARQLKPVEVMSVAAVAYVPAVIPEAVQQNGWVCVTRPPTAWLMLRRDAVAGEREPMVLPVRADAALSDFVVPKAAFDRGLATRWQAGDRFRMQFGGRKGSWYRGTVVSVSGPLTGAMADPWEALAVKWEDSGSSAMPRVSPWEVEFDPNSIEAKVAEQRSRLQKECRRQRTSKRTAEGLPEAEPELQRQRSDTVSGSLLGAAARDPAALAATGESRQRSTRGAAASAAAAATRSVRSISLEDLPILSPSTLQMPQSRYEALPIAGDLLAKLPGGDPFHHMIANFHHGRGNSRYKVPHFGGGPLDLRVLFAEVLQRGGGISVTRTKGWKDVVRVMGMDANSGVTTTNLRSAYEKSLRCFEMYMRSGAFARDAATDRLPPQAQTFSRRDLARFWQESSIPEYATFQAYDPPGSAAAAPAAAAPAAGKTGRGQAAPARAAAAAATTTARAATNGAAAATAAAAAAAAAAPAAAAPAPVAAAPAPPVAPPAPAAPAAPPAMPQLQMKLAGPDPTPPSQDGQELVGRDVWRKWEGRGFYKANIIDFEADTSMFTIIFNRGTKQEMQERMNLLDAPVELSWRDPKALVRAGSAQAGTGRIVGRP